MGGRAERWEPMVTPKELLPFGDGGDGRPRLLVDHVLDAMVTADVSRLVVPILPEKAGSVMGYLGSRLSNGARLTFVAAPGPTLLANCVACTDLLDHHDVLFGMPDTVFTPADILRQCRDRLRPEVQLVLGVFATDSPEELDIVDHAHGWAKAVRSKPRPCGADSGDIWGVAAWGPDFTERLPRWPTDTGDPPGAAFHHAVATNPRGCAIVCGQSYVDIGRYVRYRQALMNETALLTSGAGALEGYR